MDVLIQRILCMNGRVEHALFRVRFLLVGYKRKSYIDLCIGSTKYESAVVHSQLSPTILEFGPSKLLHPNFPLAEMRQSAMLPVEYRETTVPGCGRSATQSQLNDSRNNIRSNRDTVFPHTSNHTTDCYISTLSQSKVIPLHSLFVFESLR